MNPISKDLACTAIGLMKIKGIPVRIPQIIKEALGYLKEEVALQRLHMIAETSDDIPEPDPRFAQLSKWWESSGPGPQVYLLDEELAILSGNYTRKVSSVYSFDLHSLLWYLCRNLSQTMTSRDFRFRRQRYCN
jgi:hypothetical protein